MKTAEQILEAVRSGERESETMDGRDFSRLADFFPVSQWELFGLALKEGATPPGPVPLTKENVLKQLTDDLEFSFKKALGQRGISSSFMYATIKMWMWVLDDPLQDFDDYPNYGLPLFKAVALKYNLPNPIGNHTGKESEYESGG